MNKSVLIIDDEPKMSELCGDYLRASGYRVLTAEDGARGLALARREQPDLVVLDLTLPERDGLEICRELRRESSVPIIMLTAPADEHDRLKGLELGADVCLTKPFSPRELVARVHSLLRRLSESSAPTEIVRAGELSLDRGRLRVSLPDREVVLTATEFDILVAMAAQPGRVFSRAQLLKATHGIAFESYERAIDAHVHNLRLKLQAGANAPEYIQTVHGLGYKFAA